MRTQELLRHQRAARDAHLVDIAHERAERERAVGESIDRQRTAERAPPGNLVVAVDRDRRFRAVRRGV